MSSWNLEGLLQDPFTGQDKGTTMQCWLVVLEKAGPCELSKLTSQNSYPEEAPHWRGGTGNSIQIEQDWTIEAKDKVR